LVLLGDGQRAFETFEIFSPKQRVRGSARSTASQSANLRTPTCRILAFFVISWLGKIQNRKRSRNALDWAFQNCWGQVAGQIPKNFMEARLMTLHTEHDAATPDASHGKPLDSQLDAVRLDPAHDLSNANPISCDDARENVIECCAGCVALAKRVEQLEQDLAAIVLRSVPFPESTVLSTTGCYWLIIGIHCFSVGLMSLGIELT
jgi:hypothetical protein